MLYFVKLSDVSMCFCLLKRFCHAASHAVLVVTILGLHADPDGAGKRDPKSGAKCYLFHLLRVDCSHPGLNKPMELLNKVKPVQAIRDYYHPTDPVCILYLSTHCREILYFLIDLINQNAITTRRLEIVESVAVCKFHRPRVRSLPPPYCVLSPMGLLLRLTTTGAAASSNAEHVFIAFMLWLLGTAFGMLSLVARQFPRLAVATAAVARVLRNYLIGGL